MQDVLAALRNVARSPGYAAAFILTLGLGIGANTAIFSVVRGVLLKPIPLSLRGSADAPPADGGAVRDSGCHLVRP